MTAPKPNRVGVPQGSIVSLFVLAEGQPVCARDFTLFSVREVSARDTHYYYRVSLTLMGWEKPLTWSDV